MFDNFYDNFAKSNQQKDSRWKENMESTRKFQARASQRVPVSTVKHQKKKPS